MPSTRSFLCSFVGVGVLLGACLGADPSAETPSDAGDASADASGGGGPDGGGASDDASIDAGCGGTLTRCANACVALEIDKNHCGRCGHDCGGGECKAGVCAPVELIANFTGSKNLAAVDGTYFLTVGTQVRACTDVGCTKPLAIASFTDYPPQEGLAAGGGRVIFAASPNNPTTQSQGLFSCVGTGCVALPGDTLVSPGKFVVVDAVEMGGVARDRVAYGYDNNGNKFIGTSKCSAASCTTPVVFSGLVPEPRTPVIAVDDTNVYFTHLDAGATKLVMCPVTGCAGPTATLVGDLGITSGYSVSALRAHGGLVYVAVDGTIPRVTRCQGIAGGACGGFAAGIASFSVFDLDDSGFYYGARTQGAIETCKLSGCGGGPTRLREPILNNAPTYDALRVSGRYVYWIQDVAGTKSVWRIAKP